VPTAATIGVAAFVAVAGRVVVATGAARALGGRDAWGGRPGVDGGGRRGVGGGGGAPRGVVRLEAEVREHELLRVLGLAQRLRVARDIKRQ
jgi:hypothetical protein